MPRGPRRHAMRPRADHRTHQTHATTTASQMMKAWIMTPPARHTSRETRRAWMHCLCGQFGGGCGARGEPGTDDDRESIPE